MPKHGRNGNWKRFALTCQSFAGGHCGADWKRGIRSRRGGRSWDRFISCKSLRFLNLLVVDPRAQHRGIGSQLMKRMLDYITEVAPDLSVVEVNATPHSLPFYRRLGFYPLSEFIEFEAGHFARLGYWRKNSLLHRSQC